MPTARKRVKLQFKICEPGGLFRKEHATALKFGRLDGHSDFLVILGFDRNDREMRRLELLDQRCPDSGIFNQDVGGLMQLRVLRYLRPQSREVKPAA